MNNREKKKYHTSVADHFVSIIHSRSTNLAMWCCPSIFQPMYTRATFAIAAELLISSTRNDTEERRRGLLDRFEQLLAVIVLALVVDRDYRARLEEIIFRPGDSDRSLIRRNREQFTARPSFIAAGAESQLRSVSRNRGNRVSRAFGKIFVFVFVFEEGGGGGWRGARAPFCWTDLKNRLKGGEEMVGGHAVGGETLNPAPFRRDETKYSSYSQRQLRLCNRTASRKRKQVWGRKGEEGSPARKWNLAWRTAWHSEELNRAIVNKKGKRFCFRGGNNWQLARRIIREACCLLRRGLIV